MNSKKIFFIALLLQVGLATSVHTQDLKDELDALEAPQEEDLSGLDDAAPDSGATSSGEDALPPDEELPSDETQAAEAQKPAAPQETAPEQEPQDQVAEENKENPAEENLDQILDEELPAEEDVEQAESLPQESTTPAPSPAPTEALTGVPDEKAAKVTSIQFRQLKDRVRLIVKAERSLDFEKVARPDRKQVVIELRNVEFAKSTLSRVLDTGEFDGPVALVQPFKSKVGALPSIKILFQLRRNVDPKVNRSGSDLYVDFMLQGGVGANRLFKEDSTEQAPTFPETFLAVDGKARYNGKKISLNVKDAELTDVLSLISKVSNKNFVLGEAIQKKVTLSVKDTPWDQILAILLVNNRLGYQKVGNVYRILQADQIKTEMADIAKSYEARSDVLPLETRLIPINYARANDLQTNIKDLQSKRGKLSVDARTNSLVVTDTSENLDKILTYIQSIDKQAALVEIQARIVEARENFVREMNLDWTAGPVAGGNLSGSQISLNDNVASVTGGGNVNLRLGSLGSLGALNTILGVAEQEDQIKVIASPRVVVLDNRTATISRGDQFNRVSPPNSEGVSQLTSINANLQLSVTPQVTADGFVLLNVNFSRDTPDETISDGSAITTRSARTEMLVESGKTGVIGGIYVVDKNSGTRGWPLLKNLPILGTLFTNEKTVTNRMSELLMFISPKILNSDKAFLAYKEANPDSQAKTKTANQVNSGELDEELNEAAF